MIISPEQEVAEAAFRRLKAPSSFETEVFLNGSAQVVGISLSGDCPVINTPLKQLSELFSTLDAIVVAVRRDGRLFVPEPMDQLFEKDQVYIFCADRDTNRTLEIFGKKEKKVDNLIVVGAGNVGLNFGTLVEKNLSNVGLKLIEKDRIRAEYVADFLNKTIVLNGDGLSQEVLFEANIQSANAFFSITDDDKTNLLSCTRAKAAGCNFTVALINDPSLVNIGRIAGLTGLVISIIVAPIFLGSLPSAFQYVQEYMGLFSPVILFVFLSAIFIRTSNSRSVLIGSVAALIAGVAMKLYVLNVEEALIEPFMHQMMVSFGIAFIFSHLFSGAETNQIVFEFSNEDFKTSTVFNAGSVFIITMLVFIYATYF